MNWQCHQEDESGWDGKRRWEARDLLSQEPAYLVLVPRLGGGEVIEKMTVELNDICAENHTPYMQMVFSRGHAGIVLRTALQELCQRWNERDADIGVKWKVIVYGLENYSSLCRACVQGDQPEYWIHVDYLSDRLLEENREHDRKMALKKKQEEADESLKTQL
mmetsp:Transcript_7975/g.12894  ORF Transcript_7975/g.12894 Transcript_7975/m.12894 type:complete len:163 (-) Transcript_7975:1056-1544(-)|eukprot:CAMPEP_0203765756 /NCGR_PEP_ID=MMETSP0099_2-20121227/40_1 /ASSEMBLY_ACC=CAM_ASM_000209 /TAXON_ID=96639 /ORGANISM=" , Strain NY0313808BC1" /LENGTH=162 /DNA_ID=CAMNT_0050662033 /DNA_START=119 /DNA_END=607 /DNA_ORIENTATION=+